jgi:hypothetical protein
LQLSLSEIIVLRDRSIRFVGLTDSTVKKTYSSVNYPFVFLRYHIITLIYQSWVFFQVFSEMKTNFDIYSQFANASSDEIVSKNLILFILVD